MSPKSPMEAVLQCESNAPAGFALLNRAGPPQWLARVDLCLLDMDDPLNNILVQAAHAEYKHAAGALFHRARIDWVMHGGNADWSLPTLEARLKEYGFLARNAYDLRLLNEEWRLLVKAARREP